MDAAKWIREGKAVLGIEFGSTRIKAVLTGENGAPIASGGHEWENRLENGIWTYTLDDIWDGLADCYRDLQEDVRKEYGEEITSLRAIGFSAMMHGYLAFNKDDELLVPFRTWRNTMTQEASDRLTEAFNFNIPQRWSIAHLFQAALNGEKHVPEVAFFTTLAGYVHWKLSGCRVIGVGDASGMFPIDSKKVDYNEAMLDQFDELMKAYSVDWKIRDLLPKVLSAGENAGTLTAEGAALLDRSGKLQPGAPMCPPEGDAGTGMAATNSVAKRTGNVSAGTSIFSMIVLEEDPTTLHREIDMVTTPDGAPVAMCHCNNGTSDLNSWVGLFGEFAKEAGLEISTGDLYGLLYRKALTGDSDCGGLLSYCFLSGEHNVGLEEGRPMFVRKPDNKMNLANFMRSHLYTSLGTLRLGSEILKEDKVKIDKITGHGGLFKTPLVGQKILAAAMNAPVSVMETAGEGGAWGIALLAEYMVEAQGRSLGDYLDKVIFADAKAVSVDPDPEDEKGFEEFMKRFRAGLPIERAAVDHMR